MKRLIVCALTLAILAMLSTSCSSEAMHPDAELHEISDNPTSISLSEALDGADIILNALDAESGLTR